MSWLRSLFFKSKGQRRELVCVPYADGDKMLREPESGWHLAPEEDSNQVIGTVYLERWPAVKAGDDHGH